MSDLQALETRGVLRLTLTREAKRNALTREMLATLLEHVRAFSQSAAARLLVLDAVGPVFCAGMDLAQMEETAARADAAEIWRRDSQVYRDLVGELATLPVPTLATVQGPVLAGGVGLVLACDLVLASTAARFSLPEPQRGITAAIVTPLLVHRLGAGPAGWMLLSGGTLDADAAHRCGLVHELAAPEDLTQQEQSRIEAILAGSPAALAMTKRHLLQTAAPQLLEQLDRSVEISARARESADAREGLAAFLERRKPIWQTPQ